MKKKNIIWSLNAIGLILICLSLVLAAIETSKMNIIGSADWPTFRFVYYNNRYSDLSFYGVWAIIAASIVGSKNERLKKIVVFLFPLLLQLFLFDPYHEVNKQYIRDWLGCGCEPGFNANHFTRLFWLVLFACSAVMTIFLSRKIPKEKMCLRILYIIIMIAVSVEHALYATQIMMWR